MTIGTFHIAFDLGGVRFNTQRETLDEARAAVAAMDSPEGYSAHEATIYEWRARAVDGKPYLSMVERWWFGELVVQDGKYLSDGTRTLPSPLLDSDSPDYDPEAYLAAANV